MLSAIAGTVVAVVLGSLGVPYFFVLALLNAVADLVPYVGPVVAAVPAILLAATQSSVLAITVAVFYAILYQVEGNVLIPKLMEREVGLPASIVLIAVLIGGVLLGVIGVLLAVPTAAILAVLIDEFAAAEQGDRK